MHDPESPELWDYLSSPACALVIGSRYQRAELSRDSHRAGGRVTRLEFRACQGEGKYPRLWNHKPTSYMAGWIRNRPVHMALISDWIKVVWNCSIPSLSACQKLIRNNQAYEEMASLWPKPKRNTDSRIIYKVSWKRNWDVCALK